MSDEVRVFIVDDSAVYRHKIKEILTKGGKRIKVIGTAPNGNIALQKMSLQKYKSDIVTMDIMMPEMDGYETIGHIMDRFPLPVVIVSSLSQKDVDKSLENLGMAAFESGVVEFVKKPSHDDSIDDKRFQRELVTKIQSLSQINLTRAIKSFDFDSFMEEEPKVVKKPKKGLKTFQDRIYIIASSTGGPRAISLILTKINEILSKTKYKFPPIVIIQHMPEEMVGQWVERLKKLYSYLSIKIPENNELIRPNKVYIAPGGLHCAIEGGKRFNIYKGQKVNFLMPSADVTFKSAANVYGDNTIGIILTGMGRDGYNGAKKLKAVNGKIIAEHESTCVIYGMPKAVIEGQLVDHVAPLHKIPQLLIDYTYEN